MSASTATKAYTNSSHVAERKGEAVPHEDATLLVETAVFFGAVYLYLALGMMYASYFLFLLDSPNENEAWCVHALAWVWCSGIPVLFGSYYLGWNRLCQKECRPALFWMFGAFPLWLGLVLISTLLMDALDEILFK